MNMVLRGVEVQPKITLLILSRYIRHIRHLTKIVELRAYTSNLRERTAAVNGTVRRLHLLVPRWRNADHRSERRLVYQLKRQA